MDTKWKNKKIYIGVLIIGVYLLGFSFLTAIDIYRHGNYIGKEPYLNSYELENEFNKYFEFAKQVNYDFVTPSSESEKDEVTDKQIQVVRERYETYLSEANLKYEEQYNNEIRIAEEQGDKDKVTKLRKEKDEKLEEVKKENNKTLEELKKEALKDKNKRYKVAKDYVDARKGIQYYFKDRKNNAIYTNLQHGIKIEDYLKSGQLLYEKKFPQNENKGYGLGEINNWCLNNGFEGYFMIPQKVDSYSQVHEDYKYFNSIRTRILKEGVILLISIISLIFLYRYLRKNEEVISNYIETIKKYYNKIPLDIRIFIFMIYTVIILHYVRYVLFFYKPYNISHLYKLTFVAVYVLYFLFNTKETMNLKKNRDEFKIQRKGSLIYKLSCFTKENLENKNIILKIIGIFVFTMIVPVAGILVICLNNEAIVIPTIYIIIYLIIIPPYVFKKVIYFIKITKGTEEIVLGNLSYVIEEKGKDNLCKLARNINNIGDGFKKSLESQVKSERLKSELITNVSHDLKTPLTSIINYINLLKKEDLSKEEIEGYIAVLDKKSVRLKVLIEDLFEASKVSSGAVELNIEKVNVSELLKQALGEFDEKIKNSSLTFRVNNKKENVYLNLDGKKTWRVFENLIGNILKYSQAGSRVYIDLIEENSKVIITMKNISAYEMDFDVEEIFERFKRGDKSRNMEGSGLGLAIAKSIVELQGGKLSIQIDGDLFKVIVEFIQ